MLYIGQTAVASLKVQPSDTAAALSLSAEDAFPAVFATSRMIALMELAAARLMRSMLKPGDFSVGISLNDRAERVSLSYPSCSSTRIAAFLLASRPRNLLAPAP
jgi:hypothetical protein